MLWGNSRGRGEDAPAEDGRNFSGFIADGGNMAIRGFLWLRLYLFVMHL